MERVFIAVKVSYTEFGYTNIFVGKGDGVVLFKDAVDDDTMYILAHGSEGNRHMVWINDMLMVPSILALSLKMRGYIPENIRHIKMISCYGGYQSKVDIGNGITVEPAHNFKEPVCLRYNKSVDGGCILEIAPKSELFGHGIKKFLTTVGQFILALSIAKKVQRMLKEMDVVVFATAAIRQELKINVPAVGRV